MKVGVAISSVTERWDLAKQASLAWQEAGIWPTITIDFDHQGVAWNKNQGIRHLMETGCDHLFLADDDTYPKTEQSWRRYVTDPAQHLMLCWGKSRQIDRDSRYTYWSWPRGVMLYLTRDVVERVGGMRTEFRNGHEHVEYSQRIHNAGFTPRPFMDLDQDPGRWFHCEDMRRPGESLASLGRRRKAISSVRRTKEDAAHNNALLESLVGNADYVEYR